jgi:hypothetical protein
MRDCNVLSSIFEQGSCEAAGAALSLQHRGSWLSRRSARDLCVLGTGGEESAKAAGADSSGLTEAYAGDSGSVDVRLSER